MVRRLEPPLNILSTVDVGASTPLALQGRHPADMCKGLASNHEGLLSNDQPHSRFTILPLRYRVRASPAGGDGPGC